MLLMVGKGIRGVIYHSIYQYAKANDKCIKDYDENKESSHLRKRFQEIILSGSKILLNLMKIS